jgi:hypothetical protein
VNDISSYDVALDPDMTALPGDPRLSADLGKTLIKDIVHEVIEGFPLFMVNIESSLGWYTGNDSKHHICQPKEAFEFTFRYPKMTPRSSVRYSTRTLFDWKERSTELRITMAEGKSGLVSSNLSKWLLLPTSVLVGYSFQDRKEF